MRSMHSIPSQHYPPPLYSLFYPNNGDYIAFISNLS
jgi:hypothetical protein